MSTLLAIDPGTVQSAAVWLNGDTILNVGIYPNEQLLEFIATESVPTHLAIEMVASYGMPVGKEVFETVLWIGRFIERFNGPHTKVYRKDVKLHLCGSVRAKDGNIRQALLDRFGGKDAVGTKKAPGPLYGVSKDMWSALAVGLTWMDKVK